MKNILIFVFLSFALLGVARSDSCNTETEDCIEEKFCSQNFTSAAIQCGSGNVCCMKANNILKIKSHTCGSNQFKLPLKSLKLPWSASIEENGKRVCSGSLINSRVVLTLAQCVSGKNPGSLKVKLGSWISGGGFKIVENLNVEKIIVHPKFTDGQSNDDIALIVLETPSSDNVFVNSICLPTDNDDLNGKSCVLMGFEETSSSKMNVEGMKVSSCENFAKLAALLPQNSLCTEKNVNMTLSSVGAGLVCPIGDEKGAYELAGIFVDGNDSTPSVFVKTSGYYNWIDENMKELKIDSGSYVFDPTASRGWFSQVKLDTKYFSFGVGG